MTKSISAVAIGTFAILAMSFLAVTPAFAAVNLQDSGFKVNGLTTDTIQPGDDFQVTLNADIDGNDEVEYFRVRLYRPGDSGDNWVSTDCQAVGRRSSLNDENIRFNTETPSDIPNGPYRVHLLPFGIQGEAQSNGCDLANDIGSGKFYDDRLFVDDDEDVVGNSTSNSGSGGSNNTGSMSQWDTILASLKAILDQLKNPTTTPAPGNRPAHCATMPTYTSFNRVEVQTWLFNNGYSAPFQAVGITNAMQFYGPNIIWGSASVSAYTQATAACK